MVNVTDMPDVEIPNSDLLVGIFSRQLELMEKYHKIEDDNKLLTYYGVPVDLHDRRGQQRLKDFAWRITEELGEATAALEDHPDDDTHFIEELSDALHFLVELMILSGHRPSDIVDDIYVLTGINNTGDSLTYLMESSAAKLQVGLPVRMYIYQVIHHLSRAMNCLKNKPWKQTHILTDTPKYRQHLSDTFWSFFYIMSSLKLTPAEVYTIYIKKSEVNKFRQRSQY